MTIQNWIDSKLIEIAEKLPIAVHSDPASFTCGYNVGAKNILLQLDRFIKEQDTE